MNFGLPAIDYIVIAVYMAIMLGVGFYFTRLVKGGKDFFIGGNLIPWWVAGVSLYMTLFSAWTFTGAASFTYNTGWYGILYFATCCNALPSKQLTFLCYLGTGFACSNVRELFWMKSQLFYYGKKGV